MTHGDAALFEYVDVPSVTSVTPSRGPYGGGTVVEVEGHNFVGETIVCKFGDKVSPVKATIMSQARILCQTPPIGGGGDHVFEDT